MASKIFVGNLNFSTTRDALEEFLAPAGTITDIHLPNDRQTGRPRGFAFVEFENDDDAMGAIAMFNGQELDGRRLRINEAEDRPPRSFGAVPEGGFDDGDGGAFHRGGKGRPSRPKGSRRNLRGKKRSL